MKTAHSFTLSRQQSSERNIAQSRANCVEKFKTFRITFTFPVLNHAAEVAFLVSGSGKAQILSEVLQPGTEKYPAQRIQPENGRLLWLLTKKRQFAAVSHYSSAVNPLLFCCISTLTWPEPSVTWCLTTFSSCLAYHHGAAHLI